MANVALVIFKGFTVSAGATGVISQVLMVSSLLLYQRPSNTSAMKATKATKATAQAQAQTGKRRGGAVAVGASEMDRHEQHEEAEDMAEDISSFTTTIRPSILSDFLISNSGKRWWTSFVGMNTVLALVACALAGAARAEYDLI